MSAARQPRAMEPLLVAPAEEGDCDALAALTHRALSPSLLHRRVFGGVAPGDDEAFQATRLRAALSKPGMEVLKATRAGKLVGVSLHALPKSADSTPAPKPKKLFPEGTNLELAHDLFGSSESISEPHFYISILAVEPEAQGMGVGTALLRAICQRAEEQSVSVHLKATPEGMSLYKRFGFEANGEVVRPKADPEIEHWPLVRRPMTFRHLTRDDLPHLARVHRLAFAPTAIVRYLQKDVDPQAFDDFFIRRFDKRLQETDEKQDGSSVFTVARRGDAILGFAWSTREPAAADRPKEDQEAEERPLMAGADPVRSREFLGALERHAKNVPFPHWNLHILSIDPTMQRAGVGRRLVQLVIDRAQAEGLPVTLESTELGLPLYRSMGFKDFAEVLVAEQDETVKLRPMVYGRDEP